MGGGRTSTQIYTNRIECVQTSINLLDQIMTFEQFICRSSFCRAIVFFFVFVDFYSLLRILVTSPAFHILLVIFFLNLYDVRQRHHQLEPLWTTTNSLNEISCSVRMCLWEWFLFSFCPFSSSSTSPSVHFISFQFASQLTSNISQPVIIIYSSLHGMCSFTDLRSDWIGLFHVSCPFIKCDCFIFVRLSWTLYFIFVFFFYSFFSHCCHCGLYWKIFFNQRKFGHIRRHSHTNTNINHTNIGFNVEWWWK